MVAILSSYLSLNVRLQTSAIPSLQIVYIVSAAFTEITECLAQSFRFHIYSPHFVSA